MYCIYCGEDLTDDDGELDCGRGGRYSQQFSGWLEEQCQPGLLRQSPPLTLQGAPPGGLVADGKGWFCPGCARRLGSTYACKACGIDLGKRMREILHMNPHEDGRGGFL
jgi:hypothetical protein